MSNGGSPIPKEEIPELFQEGFYRYFYDMGFKDASEGKRLDVSGMRSVAKKLRPDDVPINASLVVSAYAAGCRRAKLGDGS